MLNLEVLPDLDESIGYTRSLGKPTVAQLLGQAQGTGRPLVQPRCGVGDHAAMRELLIGLERQAAPDVLTTTIDSHTRLLQFASVRRALNADPGKLNGYPLVTHGWERGRELNEATSAPLQVRHGSPDGRLLFDTAVAAGFTSYEGGGIGYNVPYCKEVPITESLRTWQEVDRKAGEVTAAGLTIDRELFGTLTAVLMPPSICIATTLLEAVLAVAEGVRCVSVSYPQGGHLWQDLAALRAIPRLASRYFDTSDGPSGVRVHTVLHQFMGVFPQEREQAAELITYGGLTAALGGVAKVVTKSPAEARGIPSQAENSEGMRLTRLGFDAAAGFRIDEERVAAEVELIEREVRELIDPVLERTDLVRAIGEAFEEGRLDVPFAASRFVRSEVVPCRDPEGAIRFAGFGSLPFGAGTRRRNDECLRSLASAASTLDSLVRDVNFMAEEQTHGPRHWLAAGSS
ncbi:methylaspartate mutase epsilon subunit [Kitasatospora sp. MAP12-15]|uniref:methylaspartate mutase n=1 Tax=unclassified Kitasatospora TaxID=2633591 RepID=UPI002473D224|nr:methylaspartate mutase [Kitasatospora sp. MAP12-44]MDH6114562.1 methylaspartate mutase epsilon subunit [Kitasatospora sp. MAP12-44]